MYFTIRHHTRYHYPHPVRLGPQQLRFHPRDDGAQRVVEHRLTVTPLPAGHNEQFDLEGNRVTRVWFEGATDHLAIEAVMRVETLRQNAYDFLLAPAATVLPVRYGPDRLLARPCLERVGPDDAVSAFAADLARSVRHDTLSFLSELTRRLFADFSHIHRETGAPQGPALTLRRRNGACRDLAVLFVDCCRSQGIAARFASGYQKGDPHRERRDLHAWPEVYLPGAGWRGFDPTHGVAIADTHVTIAASASPGNTMPVSGGFSGAGVAGTLEYTVEIRVADA